jgi:predicted helicase
MINCHKILSRRAKNLDSYSFTFVVNSIFYPFGGWSNSGKDPPKKKNIGKEDISHYVYAVLYNPEYRKKYEMNLKREFPIIPLYDGFWKWANWGKKLMEIHICFEEVAPYPLKVKSLSGDGQ